MNRICLTIDLDLVDHLAGGVEIDELGPELDPLLAVFERHREWTATWFVRLDRQATERFGDPRAPFHAASARLRPLLDRGHELGWHPHAFVRDADVWTQNIDAAAVAAELREYSPTARECGFTAVRVGWAFHTNESMAVLADEGFTVDSSAVPRPRYRWDHGLKDWTGTPREPYLPSRADYRVPGHPHHSILEVPMSVAPVRAPYDTGDVIRYLNPAYRAEILQPTLSAWFDAHREAVLVTHPHELSARHAGHPLLAGSVDAFERNIIALEASARRGGAAAFEVLSAYAPRLAGRRG